MRTIIRQALGGTALLVTLGLGTPAGATPPETGRPALAPPEQNPFGSTPENPYADRPAQHAAVAPSAVRDVSAPLGQGRSEPEAVTDAAPAAPARAEVTPAAPAAEERDMGELAAEAAAEPPPPADDHAIAALDAVLADDTADPISGVSEQSEAPAQPTGPSRRDVQAALEAVTPALRACADGQQGRVVNLRAVFRSNGRVATTQVESSSSHLSPAERSCMARAAREARVPRFDDERFEVTFPVRL